MKLRPSARLAGTAVVLFAVAGSIAYASIPDAGTGKYHACVKANGTLRVIDPAVDACNPANESEITFNQQGPKGDPGAPGANGVSPTVQQLPAGDPHCSAGGAAITDAKGSTAYVCSGQPFSGTFTSPNGQYSISVLDTGVTVTGPNAKVTVTGGDVRINPGNDFNVRASRDVTIEADSDLTAKAALNTTLAGGLDTLIKGAVDVGLDGGTVHINGPSCSPAARSGDTIFGTADSSGNVLGTVITGSNTVCIG